MHAWAFAAFCSVAIHVAGITLASKYLRYDEPDAELGALAIEVGLEPLAPRLEPIDLPPGPEADDPVPAPPVVEQVRIEPDVLMPVTPTDTADPELSVAMKMIEPKQAPSPPAPLLVNSAAPAESSKAMARPSSEIARESARSVTPAQGTGDSTQRVLAAWQKELIAHFDQHKRYPGRHSLESATVLVNFIIDETGRVLSSRVVRGSGDASFDEAALAMIQRSDPVPKPPLVVVQDPLLKVQDGLSFTMPVIFRIKHAG